MLWSPAKCRLATNEFSKYCHPLSRSLAMETRESFVNSCRKIAVALIDRRPGGASPANKTFRRRRTVSLCGLIG
jgi:hypothetical protein